MYNVFQQIINHTWQTQGANEQQYIYVGSIVLIIVLTVYTLDTLVGFFRKGGHYR